MQVGRATVFIVGVAVVLAVMLGVSTTALAATPGDPDRPVVVGQPPNPHVVALAATSGDQIVLRNGSWSKGQTGGGGQNEIRFDDTPGDEGQTVGFLKIKPIVGESRE